MTMKYIASLSAVFFAFCFFLSQGRAQPKLSLKPGMWEFHRVMKGSGGEKVLDSKKCTDPGKDMEEMNLSLKKIGCQFSPTTQNGNVYHFSATCSLPNQKTTTSTTDLTYQSESAYTAKIVSTPEMAGISHEELTAKRTGDCQ